MRLLGWALVASLAAISCGGSTIDDVTPLDGGRDAKVERPEAGVDARRGADAAAKPDLGAGGRADASFDASVDPPIEPMPDATPDRSADAAADRPADLDGSGDVTVDQGRDGGCAVDCASLPNVRPGAPVECKNGLCFVPPGSCVAGFAHCSSRPEDGCEADLSQPTSCGACGYVCYGGYRCAPMGRSYGCVVECTSQAPDYCSGYCVDLSIDARHCGDCGHDCAVENPNAIVSCDHGTCKIDNCAKGFGDCTAEPGCESRLDTDDNCGVCGRKTCVYANATSPCVTTGCGEVACKTGFANCDKTSPDCETTIAAGAATCWPHYLGTAALGGGPNQPTSTALLADGTHFIGGDYNRAADFDPGPGLDLHTPVGPPDAFVAKLTGDGALAWAKTFGGIAEDVVAAVAAGPDGSVVAVGHYSGTVDFDPGPGVDSHASNADRQEAFVVKLAADGSLVWARTFPVPEFGWGDAHAVVVGADNSVYVGGEFSGGMDLDPGPANDEIDANANAFLVKLNSAGDFVWGRALGGLVDCYSSVVLSMSLAADGSLWTAGPATGRCPLDPTDPDPGDLDNLRYFVAGFTANGDYQRSWRLLTRGDSRVSVAVGSDDSIYLGGQFVGTVDFDPGPNTTERTPKTGPTGERGGAGFVTKFGRDGALRWVVTFPNLLVGSVAATSDGVLAVGSLYEVETDTTGMGLTKIDSTGVSIFSAAIGGAQTSSAAVAASGARFVVVGQTDGLADFDPGPGTDIVDRGAVNFASRYSF